MLTPEIRLRLELRWMRAAKLVDEVQGESKGVQKYLMRDRGLFRAMIGVSHHTVQHDMYLIAPPPIP